MLKNFSEKALQSLNGYYVYALIDPRTDKVFYIGKGIGDRVFNHEIESGKNPESEKIKLQTIRLIEEAGFNVKRVVINWGLTEREAFAAEASLINLLNFTSEAKLSNIVAGHHVHESLTVEDFEINFGAEILHEEDIAHSILVIKINKLYRRGMSAEELYETTRGFWVVSLDEIRRKNVQYVFAVYNQLVVAVYKPDEWHRVYENIDVPRPHELENGISEKLKDRVYFISNNYELLDKNQLFYLHKSIAGLKVNQTAQNPITYLIPKQYSELHKMQDDCATKNVQTDIYEEPDFDYVIIKTTEDRVRDCGGNVYEATRRAWKVGERIRQYKYVLSVINKIVKAVYVVDNWQTIESGKDKGRYEFFGSELTDTPFRDFIGKTIPEKYRVKGMASPVLYKK